MTVEDKRGPGMDFILCFMCCSRPLLFCVYFIQSRFSLYVEYASCVGPPKHQGTPLLTKMF